MTALVMYGLVAGSLVAAGAWALDGVCRISRRPTRFTWVGALFLAVLLVAIAPFRSTPIVGPGSTSGAASVIQATLPPVFAAAGSLIPRWFDPFLAVAWVGASSLTFLAFAVALARFRRARRAWPVVDLAGVRVRLAPDGGPVVAGLWRPEIIVPRWLLEYGRNEQILVLEHEAEHVRARDPMLLGLSCALVALLPWHPAAWWMLSRVRLGAELDCDLRVLRSGVGARTYGELLVDLAGRCASLPAGVPGLSQTSNLQKRLVAMNPIRVRFPRARAGLLGITAVAALLVACEATVPSGTAESGASAQPVSLASLARTEPLVILNGVLFKTRAASLKEEIDSASIETVEVLKGRAAVSKYGADAQNGVIIITTKKNYGPGADSMIKHEDHAGGDSVLLRKFYINRQGVPVYRLERPWKAGGMD